MKKFLSKLPVMITFLAIAVVVLALYIGLLARPVSYGMKYKGEVTELGETLEMTLKFKNSKRFVGETKIEGEKDDSDEVWYLRVDDKILMVGSASGEEAMTEEEYNEAVDQFNKLTQEQKDLRLKFAPEIKSNAFKMTYAGTSFTCTGAIVFAVVMGVFELAFITFAALSTVFFILSKKNQPKAE